MSVNFVVFLDLAQNHFGGNDHSPGVIHEMIMPLTVSQLLLDHIGAEAANSELFWKHETKGGYFCARRKSEVVQ